MTVDWAGFQRELVASLVQAVRSTVAENPGKRFYGAALYMIYAETDGVIRLPTFGMNSEDALAHLPAERRSDLRWSPADWVQGSVDWLPDDRARSWEHTLTTEACHGTQQQWESTFIDISPRSSASARTPERLSARPASSTGTSWYCPSTTNTTSLC
jgi:hypothetical protein